MTLADWLAYLERLHPDEIELGLARIGEVAERLPIDFSPQKVVCVGGTNGKGSTVNLLSSILQTKGYKVGSYTSPHLIHYNERVCVNNVAVTDEELCEAFALVEKARESIQLTYFEFGTLAALVLFSKQALDYVLLEVGLGGRLDAVNILDADLSILTNVALDHTDWLGDTREAIGHEKAGIYRSGCPGLFGEDDIPASVTAAADKLGAKLYRKGGTFNWQYEQADSKTATTWSWQGQNADGREVSIENLPVHGFPLNYSLNNVALVLQAITLLDSSISRDEMITGLKQASLAGRFQQIPRGEHTLVLDVAHNPHAAKNLLANLQSIFPERKISIVIAMLQDKDIAKVLNILRPAVDKWFVAEIKEDRGSPAKILYNHLQEMGESDISCFDEISAAFEAAENSVSANDVVLVTGSFFTVSSVLELI